MGHRSCTSDPDLFSAFVAAPPKNEVLQSLGKLVDWGALRSIMSVAYKPNSGRRGYDPVQVFKLLVLARLYDLSDGDAVHMAADSLSFRAFLGLQASDPVPDDTTLVVFRRRLVEAKLFDALFDSITEQMQAQGLKVCEGSIKIVDATLIPAAVNAPGKSDKDKQPLDPDAQVSSKNGHHHYGYKLHLAVDRSTGLITSHDVTGGATHDTKKFAKLLDGTEAEVLADKAYDNTENRTLLQTNRTKTSIQRQARRNHPLTKWQSGRNRSIGQVRQFIEGINASLKRWRGCSRALYRGLPRVRVQMTLAVLAHNLMRYTALDRHKCAQ